MSLIGARHSSGAHLMNPMRHTGGVSFRLWSGTLP